MGPRYPCLTRSGSSPQWSRWAWVRSTASRLAGSNANGIRLRMDSFGLPWNMPQSIRIRARPVVSRYWDPVTVVAPPRNWISTIVRSDRDDHEGVDRDGEEEQAEVADGVLVEADGAGCRGLLRGPTPPQAVCLPQEDRTEDEGGTQVDHAHPGDSPQDERDRHHQDGVEPDLASRLGDPLDHREHRYARCGVVLADAQRQRP